jgi:hypothetical protein
MSEIKFFQLVNATLSFTNCRYFQHQMYNARSQLQYSCKFPLLRFAIKRVAVAACAHGQPKMNNGDMQHSYKFSNAHTRSLYFIVCVCVCIIMLSRTLCVMHARVYCG